MSAVTAWRMEIAPDNWIAIAEKNLIEYISDAQLTYVPLSPKGCDSLLKWKHYQLPVVDLKSKLNFSDQSSSNKIAVIYTENKAIDNPADALISLKILSTPERILVKDDQMTSDVSLIPLPLKSSVSSLFVNNGKLTAIYDWKKLLAIFQR